MQDFGEPLTPYERLLHAGLTGDHQLFAREDSIEETWRIVQPLLDKPGQGPPLRTRLLGARRGAVELLRGHHGWQQPWLSATTVHHSKENRTTCS